MCYKYKTYTGCQRHNRSNNNLGTLDKVNYTIKLILLFFSTLLMQYSRMLDDNGVSHLKLIYVSLSSLKSGKLHDGCWKPSWGTRGKCWCQKKKQCLLQVVVFQRTLAMSGYVFDGRDQRVDATGIYSCGIQCGVPAQLVLGLPQGLTEQTCKCVSVGYGSRTLGTMWVPSPLL